MLAAVGVAAAWVAFSGETGSLPAGFLNLAATLAGIGVWMLLDGGALASSRSVGLGLCVLAILNVGLFACRVKFPSREHASGCRP